MRYPMKQNFYSQEWLQNQKFKLLEIRENTLNLIREKSNEDLIIVPDQVIEDGDQAQQYLDQNISFGLRKRDLQRLKSIEAALQKIHQGTYGYCEETDLPIGLQRLEKMPWATLCVEAAEEKEREYGVKSA